MKTYLTFGFLMALGGALISLVFFFLGFHSDPSKIGTAQTLSFCLSLVMYVAFLYFGIKTRRDEIPLTEDFGYGRALGAGVMISLFAALFSVVTTYLYMHVINPGFNDVMVQAQINKWEAANMSSERIEQAEAMMRKMMNPVLQILFGLVGAFLFCSVLSLIVAAFLKRPAVDELASQTA